MNDPGNDPERPMFVNVKSAPPGREVELFSVLGQMIGLSGGLKKGYLFKYQANWDTEEKPYLGLEFTLPGPVRRTYCLLVALDRLLVAEQAIPGAGMES